jgi:hypothetical protein
MNCIRKPLRIFIVMSCAAAATMFYGTTVYGEACTYNEALMAFQQGNAVRGQALMTMAAKDGDKRAQALFSALREAFGSEHDAEDAMHMALATAEDEPKE